MAITFCCGYCGKKIEAPDSAGGKWGKCPACHNKLYVPSPGSSDEELKLAPINEEDDTRQKQLMNETFKLTQDILLEREGPGEATDVAPVYEGSNEQLRKNIITYLWQTANGELEQAQITADSIIPYGEEAIKIIDKIALSEIPEPELANVPPQVLSGLIRELRAKID